LCYRAKGEFAGVDQAEMSFNYTVIVNYNTIYHVKCFFSHTVWRDCSLALLFVILF
jgi:hypothetical protein